MRHWTCTAYSSSNVLSVFLVSPFLNGKGGFRVNRVSKERCFCARATQMQIAGFVQLMENPSSHGI